MLPPVKTSIHCCPSHQNPPIYWFRAVLACKRCWIWADFSPDSDKTTFSLKKAVIWIVDIRYISNNLKLNSVLMMLLFLPNMQLFTSQDVNGLMVNGVWWTGVVWIIVMFYQLFGLSIWRHPFTAEHPLVSKWCNVTFLQICSYE